MRWHNESNYKYHPIWEDECSQGGTLIDIPGVLLSRFYLPINDHIKRVQIRGFQRLDMARNDLFSPEFNAHTVWRAVYETIV
jgi:hypothetical protein